MANLLSKYCCLLAEVLRLIGRAPEAGGVERHQSYGDDSVQEALEGRWKLWHPGHDAGRSMLLSKRLID